jgi:hypothetical protein
MRLDVLLVLSGLRPFTFVSHCASFRTRVRVPADQTCVQATIFPRFRTQWNSAFSPGA